MTSSETLARRYRYFCFGESVHIDRGVFWLHHKLTFWVLCLLSAFIALRQCFGNPIECAGKVVSPNTYCWNYRTYIVDKSIRDVKRPYVAGEDDNRMFLKGYQYYYLILLLQSVGFALPALLWHGLEGQLMYQLTCHLNNPLLHPEVHDKKLKQVVEYLHIHLRRNSFYLFFYLVCELLTIVNATVQLFLTNYFLNGVFTLFPQDLFGVILSGQEGRSDFLSTSFAGTTFCQYNKPGSQEIMVVPCSLPHNSFNELTCVLVFYWTAGLASVTVAVILYHIFEMASPKLRLFAIKRRARLLDRAYLEKVLLDAGVGDWFLLMLLCRNLDAVHVSDIFQILADELGKSPLDNILVCLPSNQVVDQVQRTSSSA